MLDPASQRTDHIHNEGSLGHPQQSNIIPIGATTPFSPALPNAWVQKLDQKRNTRLMHRYY